MWSSIKSFYRKGRFFGRLALVILTVSVRRILFGPKRRCWSWWAEVLISFIQRTRNEIQDIPLLRRRLDSGRAVPKWVKREFRTIRQDPPLNALWLVPSTIKQPQRCVIYLHGGGYCLGSLNSHQRIAALIAHTSEAAVLLVEYRLAPEHPFPSALEDALYSYDYIVTSLNFSFDRVVIAGDSAGGGLSVATVLALRDRQGDLVNPKLPAAVVTLSPWVDLTYSLDEILQGTERHLYSSWFSNAETDFLPLDNLHTFSKHYLGDVDPKHPLASPVYAILTGLPPVLIQVGTAEQLYGDDIHFAHKLREAGVEVEVEEFFDLPHVFQIFGSRVFPESRKAMESIGRFIKKHTYGIDDVSIRMDNEAITSNL